MDINFDKQAVIVELGLQNADFAFQNQVIARIGELLNQRLMQRFQEQMSPKDYEDFAAVAEDDAAARRWMVDRFPDYDDWVAEDLAQLVGTMKQQVAATLNAVHEQRQQ